MKRIGTKEQNFNIFFKKLSIFSFQRGDLSLQSSSPLLDVPYFQHKTLLTQKFDCAHCSNQTSRFCLRWDRTFHILYFCHTCIICRVVEWFKYYYSFTAMLCNCNPYFTMLACCCCHSDSPPVLSYLTSLLECSLSDCLTACPMIGGCSSPGFSTPPCTKLELWL